MAIFRKSLYLLGFSRTYSTVLRSWHIPQRDDLSDFVSISENHTTLFALGVSDKNLTHQRAFQQFIEIN